MKTWQSLIKNGGEASKRAAEQRRKRADAGLIRWGTGVHVTADIAKELRVRPLLLRLAVADGVRDAEAFAKWKDSQKKRGGNTRRLIMEAEIA